MKTDLEQTVDLYRAHWQRRRLAPGTVRQYEFYLKRFLAFCWRRHLTDALALTPAVLDAFAIELATQRRRQKPHGRLSPITVA